MIENTEDNMNGGNKRLRIGDLLIDNDIITQGMLDDALKIQKNSGEKIVEVLISMGHLTVQQFIHFLAGQPGVASIELSQYQIPPEIISLVPREVAVANEVFPIDKMGKLLTLGMVCPLDATTINKIESLSGLRVKPILCSPDDIRNAIERYYPKAEHTDTNYELEDVPEPVIEETVVSAPKVEIGLKLGNVAKMISELKSLPALPDTVERVKIAMEDLSISPNEVAKHIIMDPPVAAKVLSVANSAAYGFPNQVDSVDLAVALLGLRETYSIVLSAAVMNLFETSRRFNYKHYWEEAMNSAAAAKIIAKACGRADDKSIFTAGLLHDIGRIALLETAPDLYSKVDSNLVDEDLIQSEQEHVGISHAEAGYELSNHWNLPDEITDAIRFHHHPEFSDDNKVYVNIVSLAEKWTRGFVLGKNTKEAMLEQSASILKQLGMNADIASTTLDLVAELELVHFQWSGEESIA